MTRFERVWLLMMTTVTVGLLVLQLILEGHV